MNAAPWLSVIMPVFNGERYLAAALDSVLSQAGDDTEVVVSDDGSTDTSPNIIRDYSNKGRIIALSGPRRQNWVANSNFAIEASRGQFVTFLHQDDLWLPGRIASIRQLTQSQPNRSLWIAPTRFIDALGRPVGTWKLPFNASITSIKAEAFIEHLLVQNFIGMPTPVFLRNDFFAAGRMDEQLWFTADWDLWLRLGNRGGVGICPEPTTAFRLHRHSQTMRGSATHAAMRTQIDIVRHRHMSRLPTFTSRDEVERASQFSCEINVALAALISHQRIEWRRLFSAMARLHVRSAHRFLRDARLLDRTISRLRVGLMTGQQ
jgi:glycosyltransferase involved in cell wall biosynthesis